jgi:tetratricopeptide (TPR) repeat protein
MHISGNDLYQKANDYLNKGIKLDEAEKIFNSLLNENLEHPDSYFLIFSLASLQRKKENTGLSKILYQESLRKNPEFIEAINNVAYINKQEGKLNDAKAGFEKILKIIKEKKYEMPPEEKASYFCNLGSMYIQNGTPHKAIEFFNKALELDQNSHDSIWNRALAYLELGDYKRGFKEYDNGNRKERGIERKYNLDPTPFWDGTPGKTVVVYGEQGIGDEIMFASMLPDLLKDCNVIFDAHTRLADLFRLNFPNIPIYGTRETPNLPWAQYHKIDAKIAIGSLGRFYRKSVEDFPGDSYIKADPILIDKYKEKLDSLGSNPKIGISWRGGIVTTGKANRYIPLELWKDIFSISGIDFISLQYDRNIYEKEVKPFEEKNNICLNHWQEALDDYDQTAALVSNLDLIISVPQSVIHLAGSIGTPTWQLCPKKAMWQMGPYGKDMPWYGCVENIWQGADFNWQPVIKKVKEKLCSLLQTSIAN